MREIIPMVTFQPKYYGLSMSKEGFSLVELAVVLTIISVIVAGGLSLTTARVQQVKLEYVADEMERIDDAIAVYLYNNNALPCPAQITLQRGDANYGRSATDCSDATPPTGLFRAEVTGGSGTYVRIGGIPFYDLNLPDKYMADSYNARYYYVVSEDLITSTDVGSTGVIQIDDESGTITTEAAWAIISVGATRNGGYGAKSGAALDACDAAALDGENCDNTDGVLMDALYNNGDVAASFFDDLIRWETVDVLYNVQLTVGTSLPNCVSGEIAEYDGSNWICATDEVGTPFPTCASGEVMKYNGSAWVCGADDDTTGTVLPACSAGEIVEYSGSNWVCATDDTGGGGGLPSCSAGQIAEYNGTTWVCGADDVGSSGLPSCTTDEIVYYDGSSWICGPTCSSGEILEYDGSDWACITTPSGGGGGSGGAPIDIKLTTATNNGNFSAFGAGGYQGIQAFIEANGCSGYKVCTHEDIVRYYRDNGSPGLTGEARYIGSVPGYMIGTTAKFLDCHGWTNSSGGANSDALWNFTKGHRNDSLTACLQARAVACCQF